MKKFSKREIAGVLALHVLFTGNKTSAMNNNNNNNNNNNKIVVSDNKNKNLKNKIPAPPEDLPKNFYPLWIALSALGLSAVVILGILGIKKLCSKDSGDQGKTPNGTFYYGLGKFGSVEELKNAWNDKEVFFGNGPDKNSTIGKKLVKFITDNKEFDEFLKRDHLQESELANIKGDELSKEGYNSFSSYAEIRFDDKGSFECYDNKGKKLNLLKWERLFINYIAKYTKDKLGVLPCLVSYDGKCSFYFRFSLDANSEDFKKDLTINYDEHTSIKYFFGSHISLDNILCDLEVWGKKIK